LKKRTIVISLVILVLVVLAFLLFGTGEGDEQATGLVKVERGTIIDKALAVGTIEPENEISVKSKISGVVSKLFVEEGKFVRTGSPLLEVRPDPTPLELAEAKRNVELAEVELEQMKKDKVRQESLVAKNLISAKEHEDFQRGYDEAALKLNIAREKLDLLESGSVNIGGKAIESIIRAPIDGYVLSKTVEVGDPVTPLTSFQEGTVLMRMANMAQLLFKGTVDEIDVGRLKEGMPVDIKVGALPSDTVRGTLARISLKAEKRENATVFPIEISIPAVDNITLRAGYSANANIIIQRKEDVLMIPERVVTFRNDSAFVDIPSTADTSVSRFIRTGLSDAINVEVLEGLQEGDEVKEKPVKQIE
jgi:HlyD family secretion protein